jgi:septum formation protein
MAYADAPVTRQDILEKPSSKEDNMRMLLDMNGGVCEVVTGVALGKWNECCVWNAMLINLKLSLSCSRGPWLQHQVRMSTHLHIGLDLNYAPPRSIDERSLVYFADNSKELLQAYVESGEGIDRAGGFAVQVSRIPADTHDPLILMA